MFKFFLLKCLSFSLFLLPGNPKNNNKIQHKFTIYLNIQGFFSLISFSFVLYSTYIQYSKIVFNNLNGNDKNKFPPPPPPTNNTNNNNSDIEYLFSTLPPPPNDEPNEVSVFSDIFYRIMSCTLNTILRILVWIVYPELIKIYQKFSIIKLSPRSLYWNWNEICLVLISISSLIVSQIEVMGEWNSNLHIKNGPRSQDMSVVQIIQNHTECFLGENFALDITSIFLVGLVSLVTRNLEDATHTFQCDDSTNAWSSNQTELPIEQTRAYQMAKLLQITPIKNNENNCKKTSSPTPPSVDVNNENTTTNQTATSTTTGFPSIIKVNQLVSTYFEWTSLWKEVQLVTGLVTFILFLKLTLAISFLSFLSITSIIDDKKNNTISWNTFRHIPFAFFNVVTLICIGNAAFNLLRMSENLQLTILQKFWSKPRVRGKGINNGIINISCRQNEILVEKHMSMLLESLDQNPMNLSALGFFTVSRSTLTSILGVIITYLVVLIQFRSSNDASDTTTDNDSNKNS